MSLLVFLSENPTLRLFQLSLLILAVLAVYLVFFTTRDVLLRSRSFLFQFFSIILTAGLPIVGFLLYLLMRPARTIREREADMMMRQILEKLSEGHEKAANPGKPGKPKKSKQTAVSSDSSESTDSLDSLLEKNDAT